MTTGQDRASANKGPIWASSVRALSLLGWQDRSRSFTWSYLFLRPVLWGPREAESRKLYGELRPSHVPSLDESIEYRRWRDAGGAIGDAIQKCPNVAVIVYANERDHVQAAPDHPHILIQVEGFRQAGAKFVRLNPDRAYVERIPDSGGPPLRTQERSFPDNDAGTPWDQNNIRSGLEPKGLPIPLFMQAAVCELADRVAAQNWLENLDAVLYPDAPWRAVDRPATPEGTGQKLPALSQEYPRGKPARIPRPGPNATESISRDETRGPYVKLIQLNAGEVVGRIHSLLGTNRGPLFYPREPGG